MQPAFTCFSLLLISIFGFGQAGPANLKAADLQKPYWALYEEIRGADQAQKGYRTTMVQQMNFPQGRGWQSLITMLGNDTVTDDWRFLADGYKPVVRLISARSLVHQIEVYGDTIAATKVAGDGKNPTPLDLQMDGARMPSTVSLYHLAKQPLAVGKTYAFPCFSSDLGPDKANFFERIEITGTEQVHLPSGKVVEAWVLSRRFLRDEKNPVMMGDQPFPAFKTWMVPQPPYALKTQWGGSESVLVDFVLLPEIAVE